MEVTKTVTTKVQSKDLQGICNICRLERLTNQEFIGRANETTIGDTIKKSTIGWLGQSLSGD